MTPPRIGVLEPGCRRRATWWLIPFAALWLAILAYLPVPVAVVRHRQSRPAASSGANVIAPNTAPAGSATAA